MKDATIPLFSGERDLYAEISSSPYVIKYDEFLRKYSYNSRRSHLLLCLSKFLLQISSCGVRAEFILLGGSFVSKDICPSDIDGLLGYSASSSFDIGNFENIYIERRKELDIGLVAVDASPLVLIKRACFFHTLYQGWPSPGNRGSLLVDLTCLAPSTGALSYQSAS